MSATWKVRESERVKESETRRAREREGRTAWGIRCSVDHRHRATHSTRWRWSTMAWPRAVPLHMRIIIGSSSMIIIIIISSSSLSASSPHEQHRRARAATETETERSPATHRGDAARSQWRPQRLRRPTRPRSHSRTCGMANANAMRSATSGRRPARATATLPSSLCAVEPWRHAWLPCRRRRGERRVRVRAVHRGS